MILMQVHTCVQKGGNKVVYFMADMHACFSYDEYKGIMEKRENCVDARAIVVEGGEEL